MKKKASQQNKSLARTQKLLKSNVLKLTKCKKKITKSHSSLRKIKSPANRRANNRNFSLRKLKDSFKLRHREKLQGKIGIYTERLVSLETNFLQNERSFDQELFLWKESTNSLRNGEKTLFHLLSKKINSQTLLAKLETTLDKEERMESNLIKQRERLILEASKHDKIRTDLKYFLEKAEKNGLSDMDYYNLSKI